jgi:hypothetical protein
MKTVFSKLPEEVKLFELAKLVGPIGYGYYERITLKYPEHYPEEYDRMKRWESIPKSVHDEYISEISEFHDNLWKDEPKHTQGFMAVVNNTEEYQIWSDAWERLRPIEEEFKKKCHKKHYGKYGF